MKTRIPLPSNHKQQGSALLEVLISILILSFGILSLVALQATMMKQTTHSRYRAEASHFAAQIEGAMWSDMGQNATLLSEYNKCGNTKCATIKSAVASGLPSGNVNIDVNTNEVTITVSWQAPGESSANQHVLKTIITPATLN